MKAIAALLVYLVGVAGAQTLPRLGLAQAVDIRVRTMDWHPHGDAILYSRDEESGLGIGIYRLGDPEGKVVLHLGKDDRWSSEWFASSSSALVTVYKKVSTVQGEGTEAGVYLVDGKQRTASEVFARTVLNPEKINIECELSPALNHAVCSVQEGKKSYHVVLPINGGRMVASPDIDAAEADGFSGPTWSKNGTAIYGKGGAPGVADVVLGGLKVDGTGTADGKSGAIRIEITGLVNAIQSDSATLSSFLVRLSPPAPPAGTPVLEVVPANGVLRQVRTPGPWVDTPQVEPPVSTASHQSWIAFKKMQGSANNLWLTVRKRDPQVASAPDVRFLRQPPDLPDDTAGVLVAAHADSAQLAPQGRAIAYITDGALFVRRIGQ